MNDQLTTALRLVRLEVERIARKLPDHIDRDDLEADGYLGLVEADVRFDPRWGVSFEAFALRRVRGAIFDGVRSRGSFSRRACERHRRDARRPPPPRPTARPRTTCRPESRNAYTRLSPPDIAPRSIAADPEHTAIARQSIDRVRRALATLPDTDRELLTAAYDLDERDDSAADLARRLGVNRSSISRRRQRALARIRRQLAVRPLGPPCHDGPDGA